MSLCYDFQKWTMITLASVAISLTVGLILQYAHGYTDPKQYENYPDIQGKVLGDNALEYLLNYCFEHASDSANPAQDLVDKGLLDPNLIVHNCKEVKSTFDKVDTELTDMIKALNERITGRSE
jgi:hypothetical protein